MRAERIRPFRERRANRETSDAPPPRRPRHPVTATGTPALRALPERLLREIDAVRRCFDGFDDSLREIRLHAGRLSYLVVGGRTFPLSVSLTQREIAEYVRFLSGGSLYAYSDCLSEGYLPLPDGSRAGISGEFVREGGRIVGIRKISSVVIRVAHAVPGAGALAEKVFRRMDCRRGLLIFSPPGCGKTTMLRDLAVRLSTGARPLRTAIVDCRGELSGDWYGRGACVDLLTGCGKGEGIAIATRTLSPDVILVDEIGGAEEVEAVRAVESGGVPMIATVHGVSLARLAFDSPVSPLIRAGIFGGFIGIERTPDGGFRPYEATVAAPFPSEVG